MWHHLNYNMYSRMIPAVALLPVVPDLVFICLCVYRSKGMRVQASRSHQLLWEDNWDSFPWITSLGRHLQMAEPTHLAATSEEEEQFYSVLLQDVWTHDPVSKAEPHHSGWTSAGFVIYKKNPLKSWWWEDAHQGNTHLPTLLLLPSPALFLLDGSQIHSIPCSGSIWFNLSHTHLFCEKSSLWAPKFQHFPNELNTTLNFCSVSHHPASQPIVIMSEQTDCGRHRVWILTGRDRNNLIKLRGWTHIQ